VLNAKRAFKMFSAKLSPELRKKWEDEYTEKGLFQLREQTAQVRHLPPHFSLTLSDLFMVCDGIDREHAPFGEFPFSWQNAILVADLVVATAPG